MAADSSERAQFQQEPMILGLLDHIIRFRFQILTLLITSDKVTSAPLYTESELAMQLECCQTEVEFVRRRLKQTEEKLEAERQTRQQLDTKVRRDTVTCTATLMRD